jgi:hypothetical protein
METKETKKTTKAAKTMPTALDREVRRLELRKAQIVRQLEAVRAKYNPEINKLAKRLAGVNEVLGKLKAPAVTYTNDCTP